MAVLGFDKSNGRGVGKEVVSTIVMGGNSGVVISRKKLNVMATEDGDACDEKLD